MAFLNKEKASFLLTNKLGGYTSFSENPVSRFQGVYFFENQIIKVIEDIRVNGEFTDLKSDWRATRQKQEIRENFFMVHNHNVLVYELNDYAEIGLLLDVRHPYDNRVFGNFYEIKEEKNRLVIKFTKVNDAREGGNNEKEYECYLVVSSKDMKTNIVNEWHKREYEFDRKRNSPPYSRYVYMACKINARRLIFSFSFDKAKAIRQAEYVVKRLDYLKLKQENHYRKITNSRLNIKDKETELAYKNALNALNSLIVKDGIYAGLWWFFQFWSRDEAISSGALIQQGRYNEAKKILFKLLKNINNGTIVNKFQDPDLKSADAVGWIFFRLWQLSKKNKLKRKEKKIVEEKLKESVEALFKNNTVRSLAINGKKETWMDSLDREGARIEIQALRLFMYKFMSSLKDAKFYRNLEHNMRKKVKKEFWRKKVLIDGADDPTIRPNAFIAYYIYPELLSDEEWKTCFDSLLKSLWLEWGGIASLDKNHEDFVRYSTGENNRSYHRGDSWYWINNLAAICLNRLDGDYYKPYINKLLKASANQILYSGVIGHHCELSSAQKQTSEGCPSQAWSNAIFIELIHELFGKS